MNDIQKIVEYRGESCEFKDTKGINFPNGYIDKWRENDKIVRK